MVALVFFLRASTLLGTVNFSHLGRWLESTSPELALTSMFRLLGLAISGWLLLSTLLYAAAALSGKRSAIAKSRLITLPALRRVIDSVRRRVGGGVFHWLGCRRVWSNADLTRNNDRSTD